jgi:Domain of unknown function (DUF6916)
MPDLAALTVEFFSERVGSTFQVEAPPTTISLQITAAAAWSHQPSDGRRQPFSVQFLGPAEPVLPQRIHRLASGTGEALELFLVPLGPSGDGTEYEAVFS